MYKMTHRLSSESKTPEDIRAKLKSNIRNLFNCKRVCGVCLNNTRNLRHGNTVYNITCGENISEKCLKDVVSSIFGYEITNLLPTCYFCESCIDVILPAYHMLEEIKFNNSILQYYTNKLTEQLNMKIPDDVQSLVFELDYPNGSKSENNTDFNNGYGYEFVNSTSDVDSENEEIFKYRSPEKIKLQNIIFKDEPQESKPPTLEIHRIMDKIKDQITFKKLKLQKSADTDTNDSKLSKKSSKLTRNNSGSTMAIKPTSVVSKTKEGITEVKKTYYKCYLCDSTFTGEQELLKHSRKLCVTPKPIGKQINKTSNKNKIIRDIKEKEICDQCGKIIASKYLLRHKKLHQYAQKQCSVCGQFIRKTSYKRHMDGHNGTHKLKHCQKCDYATRFNVSLDAHNNKVHLNIYPYKCDICQKSFHSKLLLKEHVKIHTRLKTEQCHICGDRFSYKKSLMLHMRIHTGYKPYKCDLCEESFLSASRRQNHKQTKHYGPTFQCDVCMKKFFLRTTLRAHMLKVHEKKNKRKKAS